VADKVDAWMPLHIGAYTAATGHLSTAEHGMYLLLMMHAWNHEGVIPGEDERVQRICRATPKEWKASRAVILAFLTKQPDGTYRQKRLDTELVKSKTLKSERSEAGSRGAALRWQKHGKAMAEPIANGMANESPLPVTTTQNHNSPPSPPPGGCPVDKSKPRGQWWLSQEGVIAEGNRLGIPPATGESFSAYASRLRAARTRQEARP
jgi:uncharacterized protein YdaU (DUF1376 family)